MSRAARKVRAVTLVRLKLPTDSTPFTVRAQALSHVTRREPAGSSHGRGTAALRSEHVLVLRVAHDERRFRAGPTTNSTPMMPGATVRNETVPSGLWRDATSLFHSPKSKIVRRGRHDGRRSPRARHSRSARRACRLVRVGRHAEQLALGSEPLVEALRLRRDVRVASGRPSNSTSSSLRSNAERSTQPGSPFVRITAPTLCSGSHIMSLW